MWWSSKYDVGRPPLGPDDAGAPTGHLNSSQVAAVNHLEPARLDASVAPRVLSNVDLALEEPLVVEDGGFVAYEWIGEENYLHEPGARSRGAQVTSLDALMCARRAGGGVTLIAFEWKYLESYGSESRASSSRGTDRVAIYRPLLEHPDSPITIGDPTHLFYDPYEQLMRRTLLAWQMVEHGEFGADDWLHVHVVPEENLALRGRRGAAPNLVGASMDEAWQSVLKGARALPPANSHRLAHWCWCRPLERLARVAARPLSDVTVEPDAAAVAAALRGKPVTLTTALESEAVGGLPMEAGFYAWWFEAGTIAGVPHHPHPAKPELGLLYIGISPKRPSSSGLIRSRVVNQHVKGNTSSSTFRFVLASLLLDELGLRPRATIKKVVLIRTTTLACASGSSTTPA